MLGGEGGDEGVDAEEDAFGGLHADGHCVWGEGGGGGGEDGGVGGGFEVDFDEGEGFGEGWEGEGGLVGRLTGAETGGMGYLCRL